jgi:hypothetical protein
MRVQHPSRAVGALHRQRGLAVGSAVELHTPGHQLTHEARTIFDEDLNGLWIAQPVAGRNGVGGMQVWCVAGSNSRGDATLRMAGVAFAGSAFGKDEDVAMTGDFGSRAERGDAAADDEKV